LGVLKAAPIEVGEWNAREKPPAVILVAAAHGGGNGAQAPGWQAVG